MLNFDFCTPTYFAFGRDTEQRAGELTKKYGGKRVLLHFGGQSAERSGLLTTVRESLQEANIYYVELGGVVPNPRAELVREGIELCRQEQIDFILAVGGGSVIDSAKAIAVGVHYKGDFWDIFQNLNEVNEVLPVATVLTLAATGSEASNSTVITNEDTGEKFGYRSEKIRPVFSIMNPALTFSLPAYQTACGIVDMMSHIFERYLTNTEDVELTDRLCEAVLKAIIENSYKVFAEPDDYAARANLMWAGTLAHNNLLGVDREQDWSSHAIEHELSALYDVAHGAGLAVVFPAFMKYTLDGHLMRYAQLAHRVWNIDMDFDEPRKTALQGIRAFEAFLKHIDMPLTFAELGAKAEDIPQLAAAVRIKEGNRLGNFQPLDRRDIEEIYRLCLGNN